MGLVILKIGSSRSFDPVDSHTRISMVVKETHILPNTSEHFTVLQYCDEPNGSVSNDEVFSFWSRTVGLALH